jgi:hypothetical protein
MEEAEDLLTCARTARAVLARVTASGDDARMRRWRYRQLITYHHDHRQLTDVEFKEQAAQELAMLGSAVAFPKSIEFWKDRRIEF